MSRIKSSRSVAFPLSQVQWGDYYSRWFGDLVASLGSKYGEHDREDAVSEAFVKLAGKSVSEYQHVPETEAELYGCIYWQAKGWLSHRAESRRTWDAHHRRAVSEGYAVVPAGPVCTIDRQLNDQAAFATLETLCADAGILPRNVEAYRRRYLYGERTEDVAKALGMTAGNIHVVRDRIDRLRRKKGAACFFTHRAKAFLRAA